MFARPFAVLLTVVALAVPAFAQEQRGSIEGVVRDSSGAVLPGATVDATSNVGQPVTTVTDALGVYRFPSLAPGNYTANVESDDGGTGIGISIAANKVDGVRASVVTSEDTARLTRADNDSNVLALGAKTAPSVADALAWLRVWLETPFAGGRHERRVNKIKDYEAKHSQRS